MRSSLTPNLIPCYSDGVHSNRNDQAVTEGGFAVQILKYTPKIFTCKSGDSTNMNLIFSIQYADSHQDLWLYCRNQQFQNARVDRLIINNNFFCTYRQYYRYPKL